MGENLANVERDNECVFFRVGYGIRSEAWRVVQFDRDRFRIMHIVNDGDWFKKEYLGDVFRSLDEAKERFNDIVKEVCTA